MSNWVFIGFWIAAFLDGATTHAAIKRGRREANPVVRFMLDKLPGSSESEYFFVKVLAFGLFAIGSPPVWAWGVIIVLQVLLAFNNYRVYRK